MNTTLETLISARIKIADPASWGQGMRNRDRPSNTCCASEAIEECDASSMGGRYGAYRALTLAAGLGDGESIANWNDSVDHLTVIAAFNLAIATLSLGAPLPRPGRAS